MQVMYVRSSLTWAWRSSNVALVPPGEVGWWWECGRLPEANSASCLSQAPSRRRAATYDFGRSVSGETLESHHPVSVSHKHQESTYRGTSCQIERKTHVTHDCITLPNGSTNLPDLTTSVATALVTQPTQGGGNAAAQDPLPQHPEWG